MVRSVIHFLTLLEISRSLCPEGVTAIFHQHNPSGRTMALRSTRSLTNENQGYFLGLKAAGAKGWQPYHLHVPIV